MFAQFHYGNLKTTFRIFFAKVYVFSNFFSSNFHFFIQVNSYFLLHFRKILFAFFCYTLRDILLYFCYFFGNFAFFLSIWLFLINQFLSIWYKNQYFTHISVSYADTSTILTYDFVSENPVMWYKYIEVIFLHVLFSPKLLWIPHMCQRIYNFPKHFSSWLVLNSLKLFCMKSHTT